MNIETVLAVTVSLLSAFTTAVLPILSVAAVGYLLGRWVGVAVGPVNTVGLYVLVPALAFHSLVTTTLPAGTLAKLSLGVVAFVGVMLALAAVAARVFDVPASLRGPTMLASAFPNSGFVGIPLAAFAFGPVGRTTAVLFLTVQNVLVYTVGVVVAARGAERDRSPLDAAGEVFRLPLIYAVLAAVAVRLSGLSLTPDSAFMRTVEMLGDASIPVMLLIVGVQLADTDASALSKTLLPSALKLGVAPAVGFALVTLLAFPNDTTSAVFVIETATPAAVIPLSLTIEYGRRDANAEADPATYLSTVILVTTIASVPVLTLLIAYFQGGLR